MQIFGRHRGYQAAQPVHIQPTYAQPVIMPAQTTYGIPLVVCGCPSSPAIAPNPTPAPPSVVADESNKLGVKPMKVKPHSSFDGFGLEVDLPLGEEPTFIFNGTTPSHEVQKGFFKVQDENCPKLTFGRGVSQTENDYMQVRREEIVTESGEKLARFSIFYRKAGVGIIGQGSNHGTLDDKDVAIITKNGTRHLLRVQDGELKNPVKPKDTPNSFERLDRSSGGKDLAKKEVTPPIVVPQIMPLPTTVESPKAEPPKGEPQKVETAKGEPPKADPKKVTPTPNNETLPPLTLYPPPTPPATPPTTTDPRTTPTVLPVIDERSLKPAELKAPPPEAPNTSGKGQKTPEPPAALKPEDRVRDRDKDDPRFGTPVTSTPEKPTAKVNLVTLGGAAFYQFHSVHFGELSTANLYLLDPSDPKDALGQTIQAAMESTGILNKPVGTVLEHKVRGSTHRMVLRRVSDETFIIDTTQMKTDKSGKVQGFETDSIVLNRTYLDKFYWTRSYAKWNGESFEKDATPTKDLDDRLSKRMALFRSKDEAFSLGQYCPARPFESTGIATRSKADPIVDRLPSTDVPFLMLAGEQHSQLERAVKNAMLTLGTEARDNKPVRYKSSDGERFQVTRMAKDLYSIDVISEFTDEAGSTAYNINTLLVRRAKENSPWEIAHLEFNGSDFVAVNITSESVKKDDRLLRWFTTVQLTPLSKRVDAPVLLPVANPPAPDNPKAAEPEKPKVELPPAPKPPAPPVDSRPKLQPDMGAWKMAPYMTPKFYSAIKAQKNLPRPLTEAEMDALKQVFKDTIGDKNMELTVHDGKSCFYVDVTVNPEGKFSRHGLFDALGGCLRMRILVHDKLGVVFWTDNNKYQNSSGTWHTLGSMVFVEPENKGANSLEGGANKILGELRKKFAD